MKKKLALLFLCVITALCCAVGLSACGGGQNNGPKSTAGLEYTLNSERTGYSVNKGTATDTDIVIASQINGIPVTSIDYSAFNMCSELSSVTIPDSVTSIGNFAFNDCSGLTSITIPDSVTSIGKSAFSDCNNIIQTENGVEYVDGWVMDCDTSVTQVILRNNTRGIADRAFEECSGLTSITIPDGVTSIGVDAFYDSGLTSVTIPGSVTSISRFAFQSCAKLTSVNIMDGVTSIGRWAFGQCLALTSITIPDSVTSIEVFAFVFCSNLASINYSGTIEQWKAIEKVHDWDSETKEYTVHCTDGKLDKSGNVIPE